MELKCSKCGFVLTIQDSALSAGRDKFFCPKCGGEIPVVAEQEPRTFYSPVSSQPMPLDVAPLDLSGEHPVGVDSGTNTSGGAGHCVVCGEPVQGGGTVPVCDECEKKGREAAEGLSAAGADRKGDETQAHGIGEPGSNQDFGEFSEDLLQLGAPPPAAEQFHSIKIERQAGGQASIPGGSTDMGGKGDLAAAPWEDGDPGSRPLTTRPPDVDPKDLPERRRVGTVPGGFYSAGQGKGRSMRLLWIAFGLAAVAAVLLGVYWFFQSPGTGIGTAAVDQDARKRAVTYIQRQKKRLGEITGSLEEHLAKAEKAYADDTVQGYEDASAEFLRAIVLDEENIDALVGFVSAELNNPARHPDVEELQALFDLVGYAMGLEPTSGSIYKAKALLMLATGKNEDARLAAMQAKRLDQGLEAEALLLLGRSYLEENPAMALNYIEEAAEKGPGKRIVSRFLAEAYDAVGRYRDALDLMRKRVGEMPGDWASRAAYAGMLAHNGQLERARDEYGKVFENGQGSVEAMLDYAVLLYQGFGRFEKAEAGLLKARRMADEVNLPGSLMCRLLVHSAIVAREAGKTKEAMALARQALDADPGNPAALFLAAGLYLKTGNIVQAKYKIDELLEKEPESSRALRLGGHVAEALPDMDQAVQRFNRAMQLSRFDPYACLDLAGFYARIQEPDRTYGVMRKCLELPPYREKTPDELTDSYEGKGVLEKAVQGLRGIAVEQKEQPLAHSSLAVAYYWARAVIDAERELGKAIKLDPDDFGARLYRASIYFERKRMKKAWSDLNRAIRLENLSLAANYLRGRFQEEKSRWKKAAEAYESVLDIDVGYLPAILRLGLVELKLGRKKDARSRFMQVLAVQPGNLPARRGMLSTMVE